MRPIAILYENEAWMAPLFGALESVGAPYERVFANDLSFDPAGPAPDWSLAVNKVSPSSYLRGHARSIAAARLITDPAQAPSAASELRFPVIVKPNVGGSGAHMRRFDSPEELADGVAELDLGPDGTGLVQEFLESEDGSSRRVEFLGGEYLYAIRIANEPGQDFNLCPADICQVQEGAEFDNCVVDAPAKKQLRIDAFDAPQPIVDEVLRIARVGGLDVGGVEYLVAARDGLPYVYDINALSNFVTDAPSLVGFDPHARFARWLVARASAYQRVPAVA